MSAARIAIVGVGQVGGAAAFALTLSSFADQLLLVDVDPKLRDAQVRDVSDAAYSSNSRTLVRAGTCREASQCDIIIITVGSKFALGNPYTEFSEYEMIREANMSCFVQGKQLSNSLTVTSQLSEILYKR